MLAIDENRIDSQLVCKVYAEACLKTLNEPLLYIEDMLSIIESREFSGCSKNERCADAR